MISEGFVIIVKLIISEVFEYLLFCQVFQFKKMIFLGVLSFVFCNLELVRTLRINFNEPVSSFFLKQEYHLSSFLLYLFLIYSSLWLYFGFDSLEFLTTFFFLNFMIMFHIIFISQLMKSLTLHLFIQLPFKLLHQKHFFHDFVFRKAW